MDERANIQRADLATGTWERVNKTLDLSLPHPLATGAAKLVIKLRTAKFPTNYSALFTFVIFVDVFKSCNLIFGS